MKAFVQRWFSRWMMAVAVGAVAASLTGCATTEDDLSKSERPWNTPKNWESGLPSSMTEGR